MAEATAPTAPSPFPSCIIPRAHRLHGRTCRYLDPVTAELMEDPVKLPSGHSMDRATITRHLLSDETDPFSRARCTVDMLVDNEPLKSEIANWKAQRKAEAAAARAAGAAPMEEG